jgi:hypothetical protein
MLCGQVSTNSETPISTDRPSITNSSVVVPRAGFQVENGLLATSSQDQYTIDFPETALRFGLFNKTELRLSVPNYFLSTQQGSPAGFGDVAAGIKQQFGPIAGNFNFSVIAFLSFPTGAVAISSHGYDPALQLPWSYQLPKNWTAGGQAAFYWPSQMGRHSFTGEVTFFCDHQLTKPWNAFIEYAGDFPESGGSRQLLHFGTAYKVAPRHQIDLHVAAGLSKSAPDFFIGAGYSFLIRLTR